MAYGVQGVLTLIATLKKLIKKIKESVDQGSKEGPTQKSVVTTLHTLGSTTIH